MSFAFEASSVEIRPEIGDAFRREWARLAAPGTWWSGDDRIAIAAAFRAAQRADGVMGSSLPESVLEAIHRLAIAPGGIDRDFVESIVAAGLSVLAYVELIGITSRLSAVDAFHRTLGLPLEPLPEPEPGKPSRASPPAGARPGRGFVPMVGGTSIVGALSAVPAEMAAQEDIHGPIYLTHVQMSMADFARGLHRTQMELIAARVSAVNECFY